MKTCKHCDGRGTITISSTCRRCSGTGEISDYESDDQEVLCACPDCEYGLIFEEYLCDFCGGTGYIQE